MVPMSISALTSMVFILACRASALASTSAAGTPSQRHPLMLGSGLSLYFPAKPLHSYCLISDPCLHVNALFNSTPGTPPNTRVYGLGIRTSSHTLVLRAKGSSAETVDSSAKGARQDSLSLAMLDYEDVLPRLRKGKRVRSEDASLSVDVVSQGQVYLVTASECNVRLLIRLHMLTSGGSQGMPHFLVDALDWENLHSPHGIIGQVFPNHAPPQLFTPPEKVQPETSNKEAAEVTAGGSSSSLSIRAAVDRLRAMPIRSSVLDGVPDDYATTGLLEPNCMFSRFNKGSEGSSHPDAEAETNDDGADDSDDGEIEPSTETVAHAARSAGQPARGKAATADVAKGSSAARSTEKRSHRPWGFRLPTGVLRIIASTQGTQEVKLKRGKVTGQEERVPLTKAELSLVRVTQGTTEEATRTRKLSRRRQRQGTSQ